MAAALVSNGTPTPSSSSSGASGALTMTPKATTSTPTTTSSNGSGIAAHTAAAAAAGDPTPPPWITIPSGTTTPGSRNLSTSNRSGGGVNNSSRSGMTHVSSTSSRRSFGSGGIVNFDALRIDCNSPTGNGHTSASMRSDGATSADVFAGSGTAATLRPVTLREARGALPPVAPRQGSSSGQSPGNAGGGDVDGDPGTADQPVPPIQLGAESDAEDEDDEHGGHDAGPLGPFNFSAGPSPASATSASAAATGAGFMHVPQLVDGAHGDDAEVDDLVSDFGSSLAVSANTSQFISPHTTPRAAAGQPPLAQDAHRMNSSIPAVSSVTLTPSSSMGGRTPLTASPSGMKLGTVASTTTATEALDDDQRALHLGRGASAAVSLHRRLSDNALVAVKTISTETRSNSAQATGVKEFLFAKRFLNFMGRRKAAALLDRRRAMALAGPLSDGIPATTSSAETTPPLTATSTTPSSVPPGAVLSLRDPSVANPPSATGTVLPAPPTGLVNIFGARRRPGQVELHMELLGRGNAAAVHDGRGGLSDDKLLPITRQLLEGLQTLHEELHTVHRDLKPENVLLGMDGHVKLADFGVCAILDGSPDDAASDQVGSVLQMSPERLRGAPHSYSSDMWSLAVTLAQLAIGRHPFQEALAAETTEGRFWVLLGGVGALPQGSGHSPTDIATAKPKVIGEPSRPRAIQQLLDDLPLPADSPIRQLISDGLAADPSQRPTARAALQRPAFASFDLAAHLAEAKDASAAGSPLSSAFLTPHTRGQPPGATSDFALDDHDDDSAS